MTPGSAQGPYMVPGIHHQGYNHHSYMQGQVSSLLDYLSCPSGCFISWDTSNLDLGGEMHDYNLGYGLLAHFVVTLAKMLLLLKDQAVVAIYLIEKHQISCISQLLYWLVLQLKKVSRFVFFITSYNSLLT